MFQNDRGMKLSASLAYYTVFSLGPLLLVVLWLSGLFFGRSAVEGELYGQINELVGNQAAIQIEQIISNTERSQNEGIAIIGGLLLLISASSVFLEMQDSINYILSVKPRPAKGWLKFIKNRLLSFSLIVALGFLLLVSLIASALLEILSGYLQELLAQYTFYLFYLINIVIIFGIICILFAVIYKLLPDATIKWKDAFRGAAFTAVLFLVGKSGISFYLGRTDFNNTYGAAASIIIIMLWVYYSAIILYLGTEFTKALAMENDRDNLRPGM